MKRFEKTFSETVTDILLSEILNVKPPDSQIFLNRALGDDWFLKKIATNSGKSVEDVRHLFQKAPFRGAVVDAALILSSARSPPRVVAEENPVTLEDLARMNFVPPSCRVCVLLYDDVRSWDDLWREMVEASSCSPHQHHSVVLGAHVDWLRSDARLSKAFVRSPGGTCHVYPLESPGILVDAAGFIGSVSPVRRPELKALAADLRHSEVDVVNGEVCASGSLPETLGLWHVLQRLKYLVPTPDALLCPSREAARDAALELCQSHCGSQTLLFTAQIQRGEQLRILTSSDLERASEAYDDALGMGSRSASRHDEGGVVIMRFNFLGTPKALLKFHVYVSFAYPHQYHVEGVSAKVENANASSEPTSVDLSPLLEDGAGIDVKPFLGVDVAIDGPVLSKVSRTAIRAVRGLNLGWGPCDQLRWCRVDVLLQQGDQDAAPDALQEGDQDAAPDALQPVVVGVTRDICGVSRAVHFPRVCLLGEDPKCNCQCLYWRPPPKPHEIPDILLRILKCDCDEDYRYLLCEARRRPDVLTSCLRYLSAYVALGCDESDDNHLLLKQERAIIAVADVLWFLKETGDLSRWASLIEETLLRVTHNPNRLQAIRDTVFDPSLQFSLPSDLKFPSEGKAPLGSHSRFHSASSIDNGSPALDDSDDSRRNDAYVTFVNPFLLASNDKELEDFEASVKSLLREKSDAALSMVSPLSHHRCRSGMRLGISSANASDNWTAAKLRGGKVLNLGINIFDQVPVHVEVTSTEKQSLLLETVSRWEKKEWRQEICSTSVVNYFDFSDNMDYLRMLRYALVFVGIVRDRQASHNDLDGLNGPQVAADVLLDITKFTGGRGLAVKVTTNGPSRSGFASSSAIAFNLLKCLYAASGQTKFSDDNALLGSMTLLFENQLGLKSGRQDIDGILPGVKAIVYPSTPRFLSPIITRLTQPAALRKKLWDHLVIVDSGIPRPPCTDLRGRGLNRRHFAYLSRGSGGFVAIEKSLGIHDDIVSSYSAGNTSKLGALFLEYMSLREQIDPTATKSVYDEAAGTKVLRMLFDPLVAAGIISGGMFTGAMGGGVAILCVTDDGLKREPLDPDTDFAAETWKSVVGTSDRCNVASKVQKALMSLMSYSVVMETHSGANNRVFPFSRLRVIEISPNEEGPLYTKEDTPLVEH